MGLRGLGTTATRRVLACRSVDEKASPDALDQSNGDEGCSSLNRGGPLRVVSDAAIMPPERLLLALTLQPDEPELFVAAQHRVLKPVLLRENVELQVENPNVVAD